jgi:hypothetical protein
VKVTAQVEVVAVAAARVHAVAVPRLAVIATLPVGEVAPLEAVSVTVTVQPTASP